MFLGGLPSFGGSFILLDMSLSFLFLVFPFIWCFDLFMMVGFHHF